MPEIEIYFYKLNTDFKNLINNYLEKSHNLVLKEFSSSNELQENALIITDCNLDNYKNIFNIFQISKQKFKEIFLSIIFISNNTSYLDKFDNLEDCNFYIIDNQKIINSINTIIVNHKINIKSRNKFVEERNNLLNNINTKDFLFARLGHDLRNSIGNSKSVLELLSQDLYSFGTEQLPGIINTIKNEIDNSYNLLENLLYWSRQQRNLLVFQPETQNLLSLVDDVVYSFKVFLKDKKISIITKIDSAIELEADEILFTKMLKNIISNSVKFIESEGEIEIIAEQVGNFVELSVTDDGAGIPEENIAKILDKNEFFSTYDTNGEKGLGLGFIVASILVETHSGEIKLFSKQSGTLVFIKLPIKQNKLRNT